MSLVMAAMNIPLLEHVGIVSIVPIMICVQIVLWEMFMMIRIHLFVSTDRAISGRCIVFSMFPCPLLRYSVYYLSTFHVDKNNRLQVPGLVVPGLA